MKTESKGIFQFSPTNITLSILRNQYNYYYTPSYVQLKENSLVAFNMRVCVMRKLEKQYLIHDIAFMCSHYNVNIIIFYYN